MTAQEINRKATKVFDKRFTIIDRIENGLIYNASIVQNKVYLKLLEDVISSMQVDADGLIKNTTYNFNKINKLNSILQTYNLSDVNRTYLSGVEDLLSSNKKQYSYYYSKPTDFDKKVKDRVGKGIDIYLKDAVSLEPLREKLSIEMYKSVSTNQKVSSFKNALKELTKGNKNKMGVFEKHINTYAKDSISQVSNEIGDLYAEDLNLQAFYYAGGRKKTSRDFCIARIGKIITKKEASKWGTNKDNLGGYINKSKGTFQGKPSNYKPLRDLGGYNCIHEKNWISNELAVIKRKDLKIVNGILTNK